MAAIVEISAVETTIHCDEEGKAEQKITIHNTSGRELRLGARVRIDSPGKSEWVGSIVQSRITSYNVCYTKLLRKLPGGCHPVQPAPVTNA